MGERDLTPIWIRDRVWWEALLIPVEGRQQQVFRALFELRREQDLLVDRAIPARTALDWATRRVRRVFPGYRPLVSRSLLAG